MNAESFTSDFDAGANELCGALKEAVEQIRAVPAPSESALRIIDGAAGWSNPEDVATVPIAEATAPSRRRIPKWALSAAAVLAFVATGLGAAYWFGWREPHDPTPIVVNPKSPEELKRQRVEPLVTGGAGNKEKGGERELLQRRSLERCVSDAQVIVVATALDSAPAPPKRPGDLPEVLIRFQVKRVLKGKFAEKEIKTRTPTAADEFIGKDWIILLSPEYMAGKHQFAGCYTIKMESEMKAILAKDNQPRFAGTSPIPFHTVADDAPILVSTGGAKPIRLGSQQPYDGGPYSGKDNTVHVWDWSKGTESRLLKAANNTDLAVSPDGKWIVTREGRFIDVATSEVKRLDNFEGKVRGIKFSPDGRTLLLTIRKADDTATARVLDFPTAKKRFEVEEQYAHMFACAFTPDGSEFLLTDKDHFIRRWDAKTGKELRRYEPAFTNSTRAIVVSPDGKYVAVAAAPADIYLWNLADGKLLHKLVPEQDSDVYAKDGVRSLAFSPDGKLLAGGGFHNLILWQTDDGKVVRLFPSGSGGAEHLRFSKDGKTIAALVGFHRVGDHLLEYPSVRDWNVENGEERKGD